MMHPHKIEIFETPDGNQGMVWEEGIFVDYRTICEETLYTDIYHCHTYIELELLCDGNGVHHLNNTKINVQKGYIAVLKKSDFHTYHIAKGDKITLYCAAFREDSVSSEILRQLTGRRGNTDCFLNDEEFEQLKNCFEVMISAYKSADKKNYKILCKSCLNIIIATVLKNLPKEDADDNINKYLKEAIVYIEQHFSDVNLSLSQVASAVGIGQNYLGQIFSKELHTTYTDYIRNKRLSHAIDLLKQKRISNDRIAQLCGFSSGAYFISVFKKQYGMTPKKYIEGYKKF